MITLIFWLSIAMLLYTFIGYPLALRFLPAKENQLERNEREPSVTILLSVFNEEPVIREKIENFLAISYPSDLLDLIIVADGCNDQTEPIVRMYQGPRIELITRRERKGKTSALNAAMMKARGDVVIFTDANAMIDREAVSRIVKRFTDPKVGLVSGRSIYLDSKDCTERVGGGYRSYEEKIKELEGQVGSIVGADGALYALRRSLYRTLRQEYINDLIHPVEVVLRGYRAVSEPTAICRETVDEKHQGEMRRQTRIMAQSWLVFCSQIGRLLKAGKWLYAWQFTSHKLCRWLALPFLATTYASALMLAVHSTFYLAVAFFLTTFLVLAAVGKNLPIGLLRFPHFFLLVHLAALVGLYRYLSGSAFITWTPRND